MGKFKRYDGYVMHVPQEFIDSKLPVCPFCKSDNPHWLLDSRMEMSLAGSRTYYQCERCHAIISSTAADAAAEKGKGFAINPAMAAMNAAHKGTKRQEVGVAYMRIDDLGDVCTDSSMLNQEFPITQLQAMAAPVKAVCIACGAELTGALTFCSSCGAKQESPAPAPAPVVEAAPAVEEIPAAEPVAPIEPVPTAIAAPAADPVVAPAQKFCCQCGKELVNGPAFCYFCGAKQPGSAAPATPSAPANAVSNHNFPLIPTILMGIAALGSLISFFGSFDSFGSFFLSFLNLAPFALAIVALLTCKKERNTLFGVAFLVMAGVSLISCIVSITRYSRYGFPIGYILLSVLFNLINVSIDALTGVTYLAAKPRMKIIKTICVFTTLGISFISLFLGRHAIFIGRNIASAILNYLFFTVPLWASVFLYTPFKKD